jgi:hypothetical protein
MLIVLLLSFFYIRGWVEKAKRVKSSVGDPDPN